MCMLLCPYCYIVAAALTAMAAQLNTILSRTARSSSSRRSCSASYVPQRACISPSDCVPSPKVVQSFSPPAYHQLQPQFPPMCSTPDAMHSQGQYPYNNGSSHTPWPSGAVPTLTAMPTFVPTAGHPLATMADSFNSPFNKAQCGTRSQQQSQVVMNALQQHFQQ